MEKSKIIIFDITKKIIAKTKSKDFNNFDWRSFTKNKTLQIPKGKFEGIYLFEREFNNPISKNNDHIVHLTKMV